MIAKNAKAVLFASLVAAILLPLAGNNVYAQTQMEPIYDPVVVQYIKGLITEPGTSSEERIIDGGTYVVTTEVKQITNRNYQVISTTLVDGEEISSETFKIREKQDGTYKLVNHNLEIREFFTDVYSGATGQGSGSSDSNGANISLYDKEYGTPHTLRLYDNYSECLTFNQAVFQAIVRPSTVDVTWEGSPFYLHWCFVPHEFDHGKIQYGTDVYYMDSHDDRRGTHAFTNSHGGTAWYSVDVDFFYGAW